MRTKLKPIEEQVVVVFGGSSGIGRATALELARRGAKLVVASRSPAGLESLVAEVRALGAEVRPAVADAAIFAEVAAVASLAVEAFGRIDSWVHLAAVSLYARFRDTTAEELRRVVEVNLLGQAHGAMAALPVLEQQGRGALVHVSSVEAVQALPFQSAYAASKHGIAGLLAALRMELDEEGSGVSVTNVMPGSTNTPFFDKARTKLGWKPLAMPPIYDPRLVVDAIVYALEHRVPEITVGGAAKAMVVGHRLAPRLTDRLVGRAGYRMQTTDEPKNALAPDALWDPLSGAERIDGPFAARTHVHSLQTWMATHPWATRALALAAVSLGAVVGARAAR